MLIFRSRRGVPAERADAPGAAPDPRPAPPPRRGAPAADDSVDLAALGRALWRRRWLVALAPPVLGAALALAVSMLPDRFTARATVMLDPRPQRVVDSREAVVPDLELSGPILESEMAVLRAPDTLRAAVAALGAARFEGLVPPGAGPMALVERLARDIAVTRVGTSYVIGIAVSGRDPALAADLANALARAYIRAQLAGRQDAAERATAWLRIQVEARRDELAGAEQAVARYKRAQLAQSGVSEAVIEEQLGALTRRLAETRSDKAAETARLDQIETLVARDGAIAAAEVLEAPVLTDLRRERAALLREETRLAMTLGPGHADRQAIAAERARLDRALAAEVGNLARARENEIAVLARRETGLAAEVASLETRMSDLAVADLRLRQLDREAEAARNGYETLLARLGETRAQVELQRAEAKLITAATPPAHPSAPRPGLWGVFGASLGLTLALGAALGLELSRRGFRDAAGLEAATGLPVLAVLPRARITRPRGVLRLLHGAPYALYADRVRQLRTTLSLTRGGARSILLLSSLPGEGKTTAALALAWLYARAGARVVLVDLDTRRAALQSELELSGAGDLSEVLDGTAPLEAAIHSPPGLGFDVVATGREYALLADAVPAERMRGLMRALKARYDVVLIDAPPVLAVPDGLSIAAGADTLLYLVRSTASPRRQVAQGLSALQNVGLGPDGLILTMADPGAEGGGYGPA